MYYSRLQVICDPSYSEMLMAEIAEAGFDTFMENEKGFEAYTEQDNFDHDALQEIKNRYSESTPLEFHHDRVEKKNWNEEWEKNYEPVMVGNDVIVRAEFHTPEKKYPYEIIVTPKMSFGTGHHQTTYLMLKAQLSLDHEDKVVMDAGTGTAVLSIMASKRGARKIEAFDIDEWSVENGNENAAVNQCTNIVIRQGKISDLSFDHNFDIILANINKNILLEEMHQYAAYLMPGGKLLISGFFEKDIPDLLIEAKRYGIHKEATNTLDDWCSLLLVKNN